MAHLIGNPSLLTTPMDSFSKMLAPLTESVHNELAQLKQKRQAPAGIIPLEIPSSTQNVPVLDGHVDENEWENALQIPLEEGVKGSKIYFMSDGSNLYIGVQAKEVENTYPPQGFHFYFHTNLSPLIANEYVDIEPCFGFQGGRVTNIQLREQATTVQQPAKPDFLGDSLSLRSSKGMYSDKIGYHVELQLNFEDVGIYPGAPFSAHAIVEGRAYVGGDRFRDMKSWGVVGSQEAPKWFIIPKQVGTGRQ